MSVLHTHPTTTVPHWEQCLLDRGHFVSQHIPALRKYIGEDDVKDTLTNLTDAYLRDDVGIKKGAQRGCLLKMINTTVYPPQRKTRGFALLVGVDKYKHFKHLGALPTNDVRDIAAALRAHEYDITTCENPTSLELKEAVRTFQNKLLCLSSVRRGDNSNACGGSGGSSSSSSSGSSSSGQEAENVVALTFFSGHGVQVVNNTMDNTTGEPNNYLIAVDTPRVPKEQVLGARRCIGDSGCEVAGDGVTHTHQTHKCLRACTGREDTIKRQHFAAHAVHFQDDVMKAVRDSTRHLDAQNVAHVHVLDCCRENPALSAIATTKTTSDGGGRTFSINVGLGSNELVAYACAPGEEANNPLGGKNGLYTEALLPYLKGEPEVSVYDTFIRASDDVEDKLSQLKGSSGVVPQKPEINSSLGGLWNRMGWTGRQLSS